jgi:methylthioribose-1-phosphate isomerase
MDTTIAWSHGRVVIIDQRALPHDTRTLDLATVDELIDAIATLAVRGAPALGVAGALGVALAAFAHTRDGATDRAAVHDDAERLARARPTAVNLRWGVSRALARLDAGPRAVLAEGRALLEQDEQTNRAMGVRAADLVLELCPRRPLRVLTHCNTGRLAAVAWGTALGAVRELHRRGVLGEVLADETRPLLQGARLTAWELREAGIEHRLCVDGAAAFALSRGMADCVLVGADRVCANRDTANKIGTYGLALAAARHAIPFIVVAPESTIDLTLAAGDRIVIEERRPEEVTEFAGVRVAPAGTGAYNPAFDVTPGELITAVVTEARTWRG